MNSGILISAPYTRLTFLLCVILWSIPPAVLSDTQPEVRVINAVSDATGEASMEQRNASIDWSIYLLEKMWDVVSGVPENNAFAAEVEEWNGGNPVSLSRFHEDLAPFLERQLEALAHLRSMTGQCKELNERAGKTILACIDDSGREPGAYMVSGWSAYGLDSQPTLMLLHYKCRATYFYSKPKRDELQTVWEAHSPDSVDACLTEIEDEDIRKKQTPMSNASVLIGLYYLKPNLSHSTGEDILYYYLGRKLCELNELYDSALLEIDDFLDLGIPEFCEASQ